MANKPGFADHLLSTPAGYEPPDFEMIRQSYRLEKNAHKGGTIYFVSYGEDGPIKIGFTTNLSYRLKSLQTSCPFELVILATKDGTPAHEQELHERFIRHTVASHLRNSSVPGEQISALLGHKDRTDTLERTSERYAHADPLKMRQAIRALTILYSRVEAEAAKWSADHLLTITPDNNKILIAARVKKV